MAVAPDAADEEAQNSLTKNILTTIKVSLCTLNVYRIHSSGFLGLNVFSVFPRLCSDVVQFCSKSASCHFAEKLSSGSHKVSSTENWTFGVISTSRLRGGGLHYFCPRSSKALVTSLLPISLVAKQSMPQNLIATRDNVTVLPPIRYNVPSWNCSLTYITIVCTTTAVIVYERNTDDDVIQFTDQMV